MVLVFLPVRFYVLFPYVSGVYYLRCYPGVTFPMDSG